MGFFSALGAIGSVLGGVGSIIGGSKGASSAKSINAAQMQLAKEQFDFQKDYVKNRLQWQVEDAQKAGLHPMVAAGLSPASFSPVSASLSPIDYDWVGEAGQSLAYAATKAKTNKQQEQAFQFQQQLGEEQLNGVRLDNELKVMQILGMVAQLNQTGPAAPDLNGGKNLIGGQNDSPFYISPSEIKASSSTGTQAGIPPSVQWYQNPDGSVTRSMSEQAKQANEEDLINTVLWHYDNNVVPLSSRYGGQSDSGVNPADYAPPLRLLPKGAKGWLPSGYNKFIPVYKWDVPGAFYGE